MFGLKSGKRQHSNRQRIFPEEREEKKSQYEIFTNHWNYPSFWCAAIQVPSIFKNMSFHWQLFGFKICYSILELNRKSKAKQSKIKKAIDIFAFLQYVFAIKSSSSIQECRTTYIISCLIFVPLSHNANEAKSVLRFFFLSPKSLTEYFIRKRQTSSLCFISH